MTICKINLLYLYTCILVSLKYLTISYNTTSPNFLKRTLYCKIILIKLTFNHSSFRHFVQEVNEILYLRSLIIGLPGYQVIEDTH